jgi:GGDEF domain-containing protein
MADQLSLRAIAPGFGSAADPPGVEPRGALESVHAQARAELRPCLCLTVGVAGLERHRRTGGEGLAETLVETAAALTGEWAAGARVFTRRDGERLHVLMPGQSLADAQQVAEELLARARPMRVDVGSEHAWLSLAIGVAHDANLENAALDTLIAVADRGAEVAGASGGNRWVHTELYDLVQADLRARAAELVPRPRTAGGKQDRGPQSGVAAVEATEASPPQLLDEAAAAPAPDADFVGAQREQVVRLERRVEKLVGQLEASESRVRLLEAELAAAAAGVASAYSAVQGLSLDDERLEQKRALMLRILEQNLELRDQLGGVRV